MAYIVCINIIVAFSLHDIVRFDAYNPTSHSKTFSSTKVNCTARSLIYDGHFRLMPEYMTGVRIGRALARILDL